MQANKDTLCPSKGRYGIKESFTRSWRFATFGKNCRRKTLLIELPAKKF
jgi:hypothetical protein